ncbi:hypothetical protein [Pseudoflavonifractor phocaeensis]|uniref:hypothetical protein n=1 Tax=Pseudoflavonifractor phocaeensis TaxID=1870988 RepID=UPI0019586208|nr:hypothetical protein [Pseudoflavonifractor phocaeensis]MBM6927245.1 hypothetical protein [Pseudoflavonifractor phocaeensis]
MEKKKTQPPVLYVEKDKLIAAFANADTDIIADYGPEYGSESGYSRDKVLEVIESVPAAPTEIPCCCWQYCCGVRSPGEIYEDKSLPAVQDAADDTDYLTVHQYNNAFLPRIERAKEFIALFESSIRHMDDKLVDKNEVRKQFKIRCWSEETMETILTALDYYKKREGLEKIKK